MGSGNMGARSGSVRQARLPGLQVGPVRDVHRAMRRAWPPRAATSAMITMQSWMFLTVVREASRATLLGRTPIRLAACILGTVRSTSIGWCGRVDALRSSSSRPDRGVYRRALRTTRRRSVRRGEDSRSCCSLRTATARPFECRQPTFAEHSRDARSPTGCPMTLAGASRRPTARLTVADPRQGMATADNARFLRYWWEVVAVDGVRLQRRRAARRRASGSRTTRAATSGAGTATTRRRQLGGRRHARFDVATRTAMPVVRRIPSYYFRAASLVDGRHLASGLPVRSGRVPVRCRGHVDVLLSSRARC